MKEQNLVRVFAGVVVWSVRVFLDNHAAGFVQPSDDLADHFSARCIVVAEKYDGLKAFQPVPTVVDPVKIAAAGGNRDNIARTGLIERKCVDHALRNDLRLGV